MDNVQTTMVIVRLFDIEVKTGLLKDFVLEENDVVTFEDLYIKIENEHMSEKMELVEVEINSAQDSSESAWVRVNSGMSLKTCDVFMKKLIRFNVKKTKGKPLEKDSVVSVLMSGAQRHAQRVRLESEPQFPSVKSCYNNKDRLYNAVIDHLKERNAVFLNKREADDVGVNLVQVCFQFTLCF